jgi:hypothetical protein
VGGINLKTIFTGVACATDNNRGERREEREIFFAS